MLPRQLAILIVHSAFALMVSGEERLNVVLFVVDDLGWKDLGCQGSDYYDTPHIDRLAESGVRFTRAYAAAAICSPTRASILTGKYPARLLMTQWLPAGRWDPAEHRKQEGRFLRGLPLEEWTMAEALRDSGYRTIHVGKWHLGGPPFSLPEQHGFDVNVAGQEHGAPGSYFFPYKGMWTIPTTESKVVKQTLPDGEPGEYLTDRLTEEAIQYLDEEPFFLYFPYYAVHTPLQAKEEKIERYEAIPEAKQQGKPAYAAMVESVDDSVGRILNHLTETGKLENTLIILTSDNGGFAGATSNAPLRANKGSHYEGGIRIPLIVSGPGIQPDQTCDLPVITNDLYQTILSQADVEAPTWQESDGMDLSPILDGSGTLPDRPLFWHYPHYNRHPQSAPVSIVLQSDWKLIEFLDEERLELYHLAEDPGESINLVDSETERHLTMKSMLDRWRLSVGAEPMRPNPQFNPDKTP
ncbi:MAG: sulfatase [Verrucomicrobiales bacterium]|nr:sulfatase [Verrucomicrobiales bacterium]